MQVHFKNLQGRIDRFKIVEKIPVDYEIWHIGAENMGSDEYLPLCQVEKNSFNVILSTLKTVKINKDDFFYLEHVSMLYGLGSLSKCEKILKRKNLRQKTKMIFQKYM